MTQKLECGVIVSSLETIFKEASRDTFTVANVSLSSLAQALSLCCQSQEIKFLLWADYLYWLSCLLLWKSQWLLLQKPMGVMVDSKSQSFKMKPTSVKARSRTAKSKEREQLHSLVMYLEHKTFETLSMQRSSYAVHPKLSLQHLEELYKNLSREKERKKDLKHIGLHLSQLTALNAFPLDWNEKLINWSCEQPINDYWKSLPNEQRLALFLDLLFRQKKGEINLVQEKPNGPIYIRILNNSAVSCG